jgi:hypothetical protein
MASLGLDQLEWIPPTTWPIVRDGFEELAGGPVLRWVLLGGAAVGLLAAAVDRRRGASDDRPASEGPDQRRPEPWQLVLVTGWLVLPFVLAIAYSELFQPAFLTRYLIVALPGLMLLAAAGLTRLRPWPLLAVALVATAVIASDRLERIYDIPKADWRSAAAIVADGAAPGDAIHVLRGSHSFAYYYEPTFDAEQTPIVRDPYSLISGAFDGKRLWLVLWDPTFAEAGRLDLIHRVVGEGHSPVLSEHVHEVGIELWTPGSQTPG